MQDTESGLRLKLNSRLAAVLETPPAAPQVWERLRWLWHVVFYTIIAVATISSLAGSSEPWDHRGAVLGLAALLGAWHAVGILARFNCENEATHRLVLAYIPINWVIWIGLMELDESFDFVLIGLFIQVFHFLPVRWAILGSLALAALNVWRAVSLEGSDLGSWVIVEHIPLVLMTVLILYVNNIARQSEERRRLIENLESTRSDLAAAERQAGTLEERQRLAREIHDTLAQGFTSIVMHLEAAEEGLLPGQPAVHQHIDQARHTARDSLAEARSLVWALRPEALERASLAEALARLAERWSEESGIAASSLTTGTSRPLHPEVEVTLLRAAQEALANVRKHAHASLVNVTLSYMADLVILDVEDDGVGFSPVPANGVPATEAGGFGLSAMQQRAEQLGGTVQVESAPDQGTTLVIEIPTM